MNSEQETHTQILGLLVINRRPNKEKNNKVNGKKLGLFLKSPNENGKLQN